MAKKITQLTAATASDLTDSDLIPVVDAEAGSTKKATRQDLLDDAVETDSIQDDAVTTPKIADGAVESEKLQMTCGFMAVITAGQNVADQTSTLVNFGTEIFDTGGNYDTSTKAFTAPVTGYYKVDAAVLMSDITDSRYADIQLKVNGAIVRRRRATTAGTSAEPNANISCMVYMTSGQALTCAVLHNSGGTEAINGNQDFSYFSAYLVGVA